MLNMTSQEHDAAQIIWGGDSAKTIFPAAGANPEVGLFSGGGKSMQIGRKGSALSFPFSTFPKELEERQGAVRSVTDCLPQF